METTSHQAHSVTLTRTIDAPRERVFGAWIDPAELSKWWGPNRFTNPRCEFDARPGGKIHIDMRGPDGTLYPMTGVVREIVANKRLVFTSTPVDKYGTVQIEALTTVTFEDAGSGRTRLVVAENATPKADIGMKMVRGMEAGLAQSLDRLGSLVAPMRA